MSRIDDGFATLVTFANNASVKFWEKEVTPPSMSGGGPNDTTTMRNTTWRTKAPKRLITLGQMSMTAAYDPEVFDASEVVAMLNVNQLITISFPDSSTVAFWGWLDSFTPGNVAEGAQPTADLVIECSNQNTAGTEVAPVYTAGSSGA